MPEIVSETQSRSDISVTEREYLNPPMDFATFENQITTP